MHWLHEHGIASSYEEYANLPMGVRFDALLLMEAEANKQRIEAGHAQHG